jgi:hypothetical protein
MRSRECATARAAWEGEPRRHDPYSGFSEANSYYLVYRVNFPRTPDNNHRELFELVVRYQVRMFLSVGTKIQGPLDTMSWLIPTTYRIAAPASSRPGSSNRAVHR